MALIIVILSALLLGALAGYFDDLQDKLRRKPNLGFVLLLSLLTGLLIFSEVSALAVGVLIALLFSKKFDTSFWRAYLLAASIFSLAAFAYLFCFGGLIEGNWPFEYANYILLVFYFSFFAFLDEKANDFADALKGRIMNLRSAKGAKKFWYKKIILEALYLRPFLEIASLAFSLFASNFAFFFSILAFDASYNIIKLFVFSTPKAKDLD